MIRNIFLTSVLITFAFLQQSNAQCGSVCSNHELVITNNTSEGYCIEYYEHASNGGCPSTAGALTSLAGTIFIAPGSSVCIAASPAPIGTVILTVGSSATKCDHCGVSPAGVHQLTLGFPNNSASPSTGSITDCAGYVHTVDFYTCSIVCGGYDFGTLTYLDIN